MTEDDWLTEIKKKDQRIKELEAQINKVINDNHSMQVALDDLALEKQTGSKSSFATRGLGDTKEACGNYLLGSDTSGKCNNCGRYLSQHQV